MPKGIKEVIHQKYYEHKFKKARQSDEVELEILSTLIGKGQCAADVGANYGLYTKFLSAMAGPGGSVHSFEPIEKTFRALHHNVKRFGLGNVTTYKLALSDKSGSAHMEVPRYESGGENLYEAHISEDSKKEGEEVQTDTLDQVLNGVKLDFIKCDVEGHELQVMKGAVEHLKSDRPLLMLEINAGLESRSSQPLLDFLADLGYRPFIPGPEGISVIDQKYSGVNYFFLNEEHQRDFMPSRPQP